MKQKAAIMTDDNIPKSEIPKVQQAFREFSPKEFDTVPARAAIKQMRRQIERVLRLGYTFSEVSATLASFDIHISGERIKYLLNDIRKSSRKKSKAKHKTEDDASSTVEMIPESAEDKVIKAAEKSTELSPVKPPVLNNGSQNKRTQSQTPQNYSEDSRASTPNSTNNSTDNQSAKFKPQIINDEDL